MFIKVYSIFLDFGIRADVTGVYDNNNDDRSIY